MTRHTRSCLDEVRDVLPHDRLVPRAHCGPPLVRAPRRRRAERDEQRRADHRERGPLEPRALLARRAAVRRALHEAAPSRGRGASRVGVSTTRSNYHEE